MTRRDLQHGTLGGLRYLLAAPGQADTAARPVLCFLHGYDESAPTPIETALTRHGPLRPGAGGVAAKLIRQFVVVAPQLPHAGDIWGRYADDVRRLVLTAHEEHGGDPRRTYLTGFSFGGNGVFDLGVLQPAFWAALWAVDPTRPPLSDPRCPVWLSAGAAARGRKGAFVRALQLGENASKGEDRIYVDQGADHVGSATLAYRDARIYEWLLSKYLEP